MKRRLRIFSQAHGFKPVNERISVSDERYFGKNGIIIMIDDNGKKVSAIFKDKKNANKFNRNKLADIKKLLQLAKKTKYPKAIDELVKEAISIPIEIGDTVLGGKFKNKRIVVKDIGKNEKGDITINGRPLMKYRLIPQEKQQGE